MNLRPILKYCSLTPLIVSGLLFAGAVIADDLIKQSRSTPSFPFLDQSPLQNDVLDDQPVGDGKTIEGKVIRDIEARWLDLSLPVESPWYRIELLLFLTEFSHLPSEEQWKVKIDAPYPAQLYSLTENPNPQIYNAFAEIEPHLLHFQRYANKLNKKFNTRVVYHKAWVQPLHPKKASTPLFIQAGDLFGKEYELEGTVILSVERYLHIDTDLRFSAFSEDQPLIQEWWLDSSSPPTLDQASYYDPINGVGLPLIAQAEFTPFTEVFLGIEDVYQAEDKQFMRTRQVQLKQSRRMKSKELHYLDHPHIGLLVKIIPHELPEKE
ncbi:MAG: hypothetical protein COB51_04070 [Moraxellaceae bacterium]|nr:MAG: hypothetical protein COB51_04070 [Moraxellaceae bacterium]